MTTTDVAAPGSAGKTQTDLQGELSTAIPSEDHREVLLASMRAASLNLKSWSSEIDLIDAALSRGAITLSTAIDWLDDLGLLQHLPGRGSA